MAGQDGMQGATGRPGNEVCVFNETVSFLTNWRARKCVILTHVITEVTCLLTYLLWLMNFKPTEQLTDLVIDLQTS